MKKFKSLFFLLLIIMVCPLFTFACGEVKFEDVPYQVTNEVASTVVGKIDQARVDMINLDLKMKIQTVNTYTFHETSDGSVTNMTVKDVLTTNIGVLDENGIMTTSLDCVRYYNDVKTYQVNEVFVKKVMHNEEVSAYKYNLAEIYFPEMTLTSKSRDAFNSGYYNNLKFFNDAYAQVKVDEVDNVYKKQFEGVDYYKLTSTLNGLSAASDRFSKNEDLLQNPMLFTSISPEYDTILSYSYEYGINSSNYLTYVTLNYDIAKNDNEKDIYNQKYLSVNSVSRLLSYGQKLESAKEPENKDEYTAESFIDTLNIIGDYKISYRNTLDNNYTQTTIIKKDYINENGFVTDTIYNVIVEEVGSNPSIKTYFVNKGSNSYNSYLIDDVLNKYSSATLPVNLDLFNFSGLTFVSKDKNTEELDVYTYESTVGQNEKTTVKITFKDNEIHSVSVSNGTNEILFFVDNYSTDISNTNLIENLEGYEEIVETQPEGEE